MSHRHAYTRHTVTTLTLPDCTGEYEVVQGFVCMCGASVSVTCVVRHGVRHATLAELRHRYQQEQARPRRA